MSRDKLADAIDGMLGSRPAYRDDREQAIREAKRRQEKTGLKHFAYYDWFVGYGWSVQYWRPAEHQTTSGNYYDADGNRQQCSDDELVTNSFGSEKRQKVR